MTELRSSLLGKDPENPGHVVSPPLPADVLSRGSVALDQWRGLALVLVLLNHGFFFTGLVAGAGRIGVNLFFFISGILTYRSLAHKTTGGRRELISSFWRRRLRRLYPALLAYVAIMLIVATVLQGHVSPLAHSDIHTDLRYLPYVLTYSLNYSGHPPLVFWHLWSLACEMQFYLLAPLWLRSGGKTTARRALVFGSVTIGFAILGAAYPLLSTHYEAAKYHFEIAVWPMMAGFSCEALLKNWFRSMSSIYVKLCFYLCSVPAVFALLAMFFGLEMKRLIIAGGASLLLPCLLAYLFGITFPGRVGQVLEWIGMRTYSIYLWQEPLTICFFLPPIFHPLGALLSVAVGALSFRAIEFPFLSKKRAHQVAAPVALLPVA